MGYVRAQEVVSVRHPENGTMITPSPAEPYRDDDPLVRAYPWLFASDEDLADGGVEQATRAPGERRATRRK